VNRASARDLRRTRRLLRGKSFVAVERRWSSNHQFATEQGFIPS